MHGRALREITAAEVCDALTRCQQSPRAAAPIEAEVRELLRWINRYRSQPWTAPAVKRYRDAHRRHAERRRTLIAAAKIVREELILWQDYAAAIDPHGGMAQAQRDLAREEIADRLAAIRVLEGQRALDQVKPMATTGRDPKGYSLVAEKLTSETLLALRCAQRRLGHKEQDGAGGKNGPLVKAVCIWLRMIYGSQNLPGALRDTIWPIMQRTLKPTRKQP